MSAEGPPSISDYGLIGDCHSAALVSRSASVDWCCMPRLDSGSCFGRLLDWERGGFCAVVPAEPLESCHSEYLPDTLVLETLLSTREGELRVRDFFAMPARGSEDSRRELVRIVDCVAGAAEVRVEVAPRFDYGGVRPWLRRAGPQAFTAIGGDDGLLGWSDGEADIAGDSICARALLHGGETLRLVIRFTRPHRLQEAGELRVPDAGEVDARVRETVRWWRRWRRKVRWDGEHAAGIARSALTLKALTYAPTGAIVAAATTSLPEVIGGERNWDYRFSWIRDSALSARALAALGGEGEGGGRGAGPPRGGAWGGAGAPPATSCTPRPAAGQRWIAACAWPRSACARRRCGDGVARALRSKRRSSRAAMTAGAACSSAASMIDRWTGRRCCCRSSGSSPSRTSAWRARPTRCARTSEPTDSSVATAATTG